MANQKSVRKARRGRGGNVGVIVRNAILARQEIKRYAFAASAASTVAGNIYPLSQGIITGDTINTRDGNTILPSSIQLKLYFRVTGGATYSVVGRVVLFHDSMNVGVAPTVAEVLDGGLAYSTYTLVTKQQNRFKVLYDQMLPMTAVGANLAHTIDRKFTTRQKIMYNGSTDVTTSNGKGSLWMIILVNSVALLTCTESFYTAITFTDS